MLQNNVSDVASLSNVKQLCDQVVARGGSHLGFKEYLYLLLLAYSAYKKIHTTPRSGHPNVYAANFTQDDDFYYAHDGYTYGVDTDVTDILAHTTTIQFKGKPSGNGNYKSLFIPRKQLLKLSPENRKEIISTRRNERNVRFIENPRPNLPEPRVNVHNTQEIVNVKDFIEYKANAYLDTDPSGNGEESSYSPDEILARMSGITPIGGSSQAGICHVLAAKQGNSGRNGRTFGINNSGYIDNRQ